MTVSFVASVAALFMSGLTSGLYTVLSTTLETGVRDAAGQLTTLGEIANLTGVTVIVLALVGNFACFWLFQHYSSDVRAAARATRLRAQALRGKHVADELRSQLILRRTLDEIRRQLPELAVGVGHDLAQDYLDTTIGPGGDRRATQKNRPVGAMNGSLPHSSPSSDSDFRVLYQPPGVVQIEDRYNNTGRAFSGALSASREYPGTLVEVFADGDLLARFRNGEQIPVVWPKEVDEIADDFGDVNGQRPLSEGE